MFDYDSKGRSIVISDQRDLYVYDGGSEAPVWFKQNLVEIVDLSSNVDAIIVLDKSGSLSWHELFDGKIIEEVSIPVTPTNEPLCFAFGSKRQFAIGCSNEIWFAETGKAPTSFSKGYKVLSLVWTPDDELVVGSEGFVVWFNSEGKEEARFPVEGNVAALSYHPKGFVVVAVGNTLLRIENSELKTITNTPKELQIFDLDCNSLGEIAMQLESQTVVVIDYPSLDTIATFELAERKFCGVKFGPENWIGLGLDLGDGNKIDMRDGSTHRTDTQPGREHHSWSLSVEVKPKVEKEKEEKENQSVSLTGETQKTFADHFVGGLVLIAICVGLYYLLK